MQNRPGRHTMQASLTGKSTKAGKEQQSKSGQGGQARVARLGVAE